MNKFFNIISKNRKFNERNFDSITMETLESHFRNKLSYDSTNENNFIKEARKTVNMRLKKYSSSYDCIVTEFQMRMFINYKLKPGCAPGNDDITSEHLKHAIKFDLITHFCKLLYICFCYSIVPTSVTKGILVPLLKKTSLDQSNPRNYRPVILSSTFSKLIEMYILEKCNESVFSDFQFGFIKGRGTDTAISLTHDIASYFKYNGSQVFMCSLDVEGALDAIPYPVMFMKETSVQLIQ
jgi:hypothetical protein